MEYFRRNNGINIYICSTQRNSYIFQYIYIFTYLFKYLHLHIYIVIYILTNSIFFQHMTFLLLDNLCVYWMVGVRKQKYILFKILYLLRLSLYSYSMRNRTFPSGGIFERIKIDDRSKLTYLHAFVHRPMKHLLSTHSFSFYIFNNFRDWCTKRHARAVFKYPSTGIRLDLEATSVFLLYDFIKFVSEFSVDCVQVVVTRPCKHKESLQEPKFQTFK